MTIPSTLPPMSIDATVARRPHAIVTQTHAIDLARLSEDDFSRAHIPAIAHALSLINRYTGHAAGPYSVAEHAVWCSRLVPPAYALEALLHDAHEAYLGDVGSPLKGLLPDYQLLEHRAEYALRRAWSLPTTMSEVVRRVDRHMLAVESRLLMPVPFGELDAAFESPVVLGWDWQRARQEFLQRFYELDQATMDERGVA